MSLLRSAPGCFLPLLLRILPADCEGVEVMGDISNSWLFPEEEWAVRNAVPKRRKEFAQGRNCARRALARLGLSPQAIPQGHGREPLWPPGVVGSITHCFGYTAAAVGLRELVSGIGIDAEPHEPLPSDTLGLIATKNERDRISSSPTGIAWDRLLFSCKESTFKAWFPVTRQWLDFHDVEIVFDAGSSLFFPRLMLQEGTIPPSWLSNIAGRYALCSELLITALTFTTAKD